MQRISVLTDSFASPVEVGAVKEELRRLGFDAEVEASVPPQGLSPWLVLVAVPVSTFMQAFVAEAGKDAWKSFRDFFAQLRDSREPKRRFWQRKTEPRVGQLVIKPDIETPEGMAAEERAAVMMGWIGAADRDPATTLAISTNLPEHAFRSLFELDLDAHAGAYIFWNPERERWESNRSE